MLNAIQHSISVPNFDTYFPCCSFTIVEHVFNFFFPPDYIHSSVITCWQNSLFSFCSVFTWKAPQQLQLWVCSVNPLCQTSTDYKKRKIKETSLSQTSWLREEGTHNWAAFGSEISPHCAEVVYAHQTLTPKHHPLCPINTCTHTHTHTL